jgi:hypothetical protein
MGMLLPGRVDQISGFGGFTWVDQGPVHVWSWLAGEGVRKVKSLGMAVYLHPHRLKALMSQYQMNQSCERRFN